MDEEGGWGRKVGMIGGWMIGGLWWGKDNKYNF